MSWSDSYIGIPFADSGRSMEGCDCYGLAVLVYRQERGLELASYAGAYVSCEERAEIGGLFSSAIKTGPWHLVTDAPRPFDIALFRRGRVQAHCGIVVRQGLMLHIQGDDQAKIERYTGGEWKHRLAGHFRHVDLIGEGGDD